MFGINVHNFTYVIFSPKVPVHPDEPGFTRILKLGPLLKHSSQTFVSCDKLSTSTAGRIHLESIGFYGQSTSTNFLI